MHLEAQIKIKANALENFDKLDSRKRRKKLLTRHNKTKRGANVLGVAALTRQEEVEFKQLDQTRTNLALQRDSIKESSKSLLQELTSLKSEMRCDSESYYYAFENHWKSNWKSKGAYHGGQWN